MGRDATGRQPANRHGEVVWALAEILLLPNAGNRL